MKSRKMKTVLLATCIVSTGIITSCASTPHTESAGQYIDSSMITTKVKAKLLADKEVNGSEIQVKTYKNIVQLSGFVNSLQQKHRAEIIAYRVEGVRYVQDSLIIK